MSCAKSLWMAGAGVLIFAGNMAGNPRPSGLLHDTAVDGWSLRTAYGPGMNEKYGSANNSKHYHSPARVYFWGYQTVEVEFVGEVGSIYQIESSIGLDGWSPVSELIEGDGEPVRRFFNTREDDRRFYRVVTE